MAYQFANSIEAKKWLRGYCVRHDLTWPDLVRLMERTTRKNSAIGQWVPFASELFLREQFGKAMKTEFEQPTLKPRLGPMLQMLNSMRSEEELRDYLATMLFDDIVAIATAVKQKRMSRGKSTRKKAGTVQESKPASES